MTDQKITPLTKQASSGAADSATEFACENTDRHLWPATSPFGAPEEKIFVTATGGIGINVSGSVYVKPLKEWHRLAGGPLSIHSGVLSDDRFLSGTSSEPLAASAPAGDGGEVDTLRSSPSFHADPIEQLAFELAWELEEAELRTNDLVTINRDKLKAIARRMVSRARPAPAVEVREAAIEECARFLASEYPDNANTNAFCAALRTLSASPREMGQESDGNESQAKATEGKAGMAGVDGPVRRSTAGTGLQVGEASADLPATSEIMDVTAGRDRQPIHESDGGSMEQPFALADAARESPAPRASSGKQEGRTGSEVGAEQIAGSSMSYGPDKPIIAGQAPGPSEPSPSSRSETAGERALSQAEVRAGINILLETIAAKFDGWATWDVWRSEAASLVRSFKHAPPPSPDCSGCKPAGVQKEDATRIEGSMQSEGAATKSAGGEA